MNIWHTSRHTFCLRAVLPKNTKTKESAHGVPLVPAVMATLEALTPECEREGWVFASRRPRRSRKSPELPPQAKPIASVRKAAERVVKTTGVEFTPHDLRRTAATMMTELGIARLVVSKILNHAEGGTTWK